MTGYHAKVFGSVTLLGGQGASLPDDMSNTVTLIYVPVRPVGPGGPFIPGGPSHPFSPEDPGGPEMDRNADR